MRRLPPSSVVVGYVLVLMVGLLSPVPAHPHENLRTDDSTAKIHLGGMEVLPTGHYYPSYWAAPRSPRVRLGLLSVTDVSIPGTGNSRWDLQLGEKLGLLRWRNRWQLNVLGGFRGWFDADNSTDNIGWDGFYGLEVSHRWNRKIRFRFQWHHQSAHRGDEYIQRTGRTRIDYTREELNLGVRYRALPRLGLYMEGGWGVTLRNAVLQEPGRVQAGFEYEVPLMRSVRGLGAFVAGDFESMEERDWQVDTVLQTGFYLNRPDRTWNLVIEYYDGRVPLGEFFGRDESYLGLVISTRLF